MFDQGYDELEEAFIRLPVERESDDVLLLPSYQQYINTIDTIIFGDRISLTHHNLPHEDSVFMTSTPNPSNAGTWQRGPGRGRGIHPPDPCRKRRLGGIENAQEGICFVDMN